MKTVKITIHTDLLAGQLDEVDRLAREAIREHARPSSRNAARPTPWLDEDDKIESAIETIRSLLEALADIKSEVGAVDLKDLEVEMEVSDDP